LRNLLAAEKSTSRYSEESSPACKVEDAAESLDYLSEVGSVEERAPEKLRLAALHSTRGEKDRASLFVHEAKGLITDPVGEWIVDRVGLAESTDYLGELENLIACWEARRAGGLEAFAAKLTEMAVGLSFRSWSEYRIDFLRDHVSELPLGLRRIIVRLKASSILGKLARWSEAENEARRALADAEENGDSVGIAHALIEVAYALRATNRLSEAEPLLRRALEINERNFGQMHPRVAGPLNNLGLLLKETNQLSQAEPLLKRAVEIAELSFGLEHPNVAAALNNLGLLLKEDNRLSEAEPLMRRALVVGETSLGSRHPDVAVYLNNLAQVLAVTDRSSDAELLMRRALEIDEQALGPRHPNVAIRLNNLGSLLREKMRYQEAELLMRRAVVIFEKSLGPTHPNVAAALNNLTQLMERTNRLLEAEPLMRHHLEMLLRSSRSIAHEDSSLRAAIGNYIDLLRASGKSEEEIGRQLTEVAPEYVDLYLEQTMSSSPTAVHSSKKKTAGG
jgi:tetratricopeptide (TPR) repeat protein